MVRRHDAKFCEPSVSGNAIGTEVFAQIDPAAQARRTSPAAKVRVHDNTITDTNARYITPNGHDLAREFMPGNQREGGTSVIPSQDFNIGVTDSACLDGDHNLAGPWFRIGQMLEGDLAILTEDDCLHVVPFFLSGRLWSGKLPPDGGLINNRPDLGDQAVFEMVKDMLIEAHPSPVNRTAEQFPHWRAVKDQPAAEHWRIGNHQLCMKPQVWNGAEISFQHLPVSGQAERSTVVSNIDGDELTEVLPVLPVETVKVSFVDIFKRLWSGRHCHQSDK